MQIINYILTNLFLGSSRGKFIQYAINILFNYDSVTQVKSIITKCVTYKI